MSREPASPAVLGLLLLAGAQAQDDAAPAPRAAVAPFTDAWLIEALDRDPQRATAAYFACLEDDATLPQRLLASARVLDLARARGDAEARARLEALEARMRLIGRGGLPGIPELPRDALRTALRDGDAAAIEAARTALLDAARRTRQHAVVHRVTESIVRRIDEQRADTIAELDRRLDQAQQEGRTGEIGVLRRRLARELGPGSRSINARQSARSLRLRYVEVLLEQGLEAADELRQRLDGRQQWILRGTRSIDDLERTVRNVRERSENLRVERLERELLARFAAQVESLRAAGNEDAARELLQALPRSMR